MTLINYRDGNNFRSQGNRGLFIDVPWYLELPGSNPYNPTMFKTTGKKIMTSFTDSYADEVGLEPSPTTTSVTWSLEESKIGVSGTKVRRGESG